MSEFPKMLFRLGDEFEWEGLNLAKLIAQSAEHEAEAIADGWRHIETMLIASQEKVAGKKAKVAK